MTNYTRRRLLQMMACATANCLTARFSRSAVAARFADEGAARTSWHPFPDPHSRFTLRGLPFAYAAADGALRLHRLPEAAFNDDDVPGSVRTQALDPTGGRICFRSNTSRLHLDVSTFRSDNVPNSLSGISSHGIHVYVDGVHWRHALVTTSGPKTQTLTLFETIVANPDPPPEREFEIHLPMHREVAVTRIGLSTGATLNKPTPFPPGDLLMSYGSSVSRGSGASRSATHYLSLLARRLGWDSINFGFGGAGKGEPSVINYIKQAPTPRCLLLDVGLSFGTEPDAVSRYRTMLSLFRSAYPKAAIVCTKPILGPVRFTQPHRLQQRRDVADAVQETVRYYRRKLNDKRVFAVDGSAALLDATQDADGFIEGLHPNDVGYHRVANRLYRKFRKWGIA